MLALVICINSTQKRMQWYIHFVQNLFHDIVIENTKLTSISDNNVKIDFTTYNNSIEIENYKLKKF